jgi:hypothetical protein
MFERPQSLIDEIIKDAIEQGKFANLPGEGKPLRLDDETHVPEALRMAHKLLKDNQLAPDWIVEGAELRQAREAMLKMIKREARRYRKTLDAAARAASPELTRRALHMAWDVRRAELLESAEKLNRRLFGYNLKVPSGIPHLAMLNASDIIDSSRQS